MGQYTKVKLESDYIAVENEHYILMPHKQLQQCAITNTLYQCSDALLHTHRSPAQILDCGSVYLLAGLSSPWSVFCLSNNIPRKLNGHLYTVTSSESLCLCSISTLEHYLSAKATGCKDSKLNKISLLYPVNAAVLAYFPEPTQKFHINVSELYTSLADLELPHFNIINYDEDETHTLIHDHPTEPVDLKLLADLSKHKGKEIYLSNHDHLEAIDQSNWFTDSEITSGISLTFCIFAILALIVLFLLCFKLKKYIFHATAQDLNQTDQSVQCC